MVFQRKLHYSMLQIEETFLYRNIFDNYLSYHVVEPELKSTCGRKIHVCYLSASID